MLLCFEYFPFFVVSEETCNEVESLVFDLFANLGATGLITSMFRYVLRNSDERTIGIPLLFTNCKKLVPLIYTQVFALDIIKHY